MAIARTDTLTCTRCGGRIALGSPFRWYNRPRPKSPFHVDCRAVEGATEEPETPTRTVVFDELDGPDGKPLPPSRIEVPSTAGYATPAPAGSLDAALRIIVASEVAKLGPAKVEVDPTALATAVREAVEAYGTREVVIKLWEAPEGEPARIEGEHYLFPRLLNVMRAGLSPYLWGPAGSGKTTAILRAARLLYPDCQSEIDTLDAGTFKSQVLGFKDASGAFQGTAFTRTYTAGGVYIADECDNAPATVQTLFNSALANGHAPTAAGMVARHDSFRFAGAGNTPLRPTAAFPDRKRGSAAFADRLYFIHWPIDPNVERRATGRPTVALPSRKALTTTPAEWGKWVEDVRRWAAESAPTLMVTPRATLDGLKALAAGETPEEVAHALVFRGADDGTVRKALAAHPLP